MSWKSRSMKMRIRLQKKFYPIVSCPSPTQSYSCWWDDDRDCNLCDISPLPSFFECTMFVFRNFIPIQYLLEVNFPHHISNFWIKQCWVFEIWVWFIRSGKRKSRVIKNPVFLFIYRWLQFRDQVLKLLLILCF